MNALSPQATGSLIREFVRAYIHEQRRFADQHGVPAHYRMLLAIYRNPALTQSALGKQLGLEKSWISRGMDALVADGLVERATQPDDRRCLQLSVTPAGAALAQQLNDHLDEHARQLLDRIPASEYANIQHALQLLLGSLRAQLNEERGHEN